MASVQSLNNLGLIEGRRFVVGREGHIYLNDPAASKLHAEINVQGGKIYLRDLGSTNGTYIIRNRKLVKFDEGYVQPDEAVVIGSKSYTARKLLRAIDFFLTA